MDTGSWFITYNEYLRSLGLNFSPELQLRRARIVRNVYKFLIGGLKYIEIIKRKIEVGKS